MPDHSDMYRTLQHDLERKQCLELYRGAVHRGSAVAGLDWWCAANCHALERMAAYMMDCPVEVFDRLALRFAPSMRVPSDFDALLGRWSTTRKVIWKWVLVWAAVSVCMAALLIACAWAKVALFAALCTVLLAATGFVWGACWGAARIIGDFERHLLELADLHLAMERECLGQHPLVIRLGEVVL